MSMNKFDDLSAFPPNKDSDQPGHLPNLIWSFVVGIKTLRHELTIDSAVKTLI